MCIIYIGAVTLVIIGIWVFLAFKDTSEARPGKEEKGKITAKKVCIILGIIIVLTAFLFYLFLKNLGEGMFAWLEPFIDALHESQKHG